MSYCVKATVTDMLHYSLCCLPASHHSYCSLLGQALMALLLLVLPPTWSGVQGTHGEGCQAIYQPAAAAEARFAAAQQQALNATAPPLAAGAAAALSSSEAAGAATHDAVLASIAVSSSDSHTHNRTNRADADSSASNSRSSINQDSSKSGTGQSIGLEGPFTDFEQQGTTSEQLQQVPESVKDLVREILKADNAARTKQLVDDAWQTLE